MLGRVSAVQTNRSTGLEIRAILLSLNWPGKRQADHIKTITQLSSSWKHRQYKEPLAVLLAI